MRHSPQEITGCLALPLNLFAGSCQEAAMFVLMLLMTVLSMVAKALTLAVAPKHIMDTISAYSTRS
jgi:hypothetical protein